MSLVPRTVRWVDKDVWNPNFGWSSLEGYWQCKHRWLLGRSLYRRLAKRWAHCYLKKSTPTLLAFSSSSVLNMCWAWAKCRARCRSVCCYSRPRRLELPYQAYTAEAHNVPWPLSLCCTMPPHSFSARSYRKESSACAAKRIPTGRFG